MERRNKYLDDPEGFEDDKYPRSDMKPDRSKTDFYCPICDAHMYSEETWEAHVTGKRHLKNVQKAPGEMPSKIRSLRASKRAELMDVIENIQEPVVGLGFMTELERADPCLKPSYTCHLCQANLTWTVVINHILETKHRLAYIKAVDYNVYDQMVSLQLSKDNFEVLVEDQAAAYENKRGQGIMEVKIEKPKMVLHSPTQENRFFDPVRRSPTFSTWSRTTPRVSPERLSTRGSPKRHSVRGSLERLSTRGSPEKRSSRGSSERRSSRCSPARHSSRSRCQSPSGSVYSHTSHRQKRDLSPKHRRYSPESRSLSPRSSCAASSVPPDADCLSDSEKMKLLRKLKIARLIIKGKLSKLKSELNPYPEEVFSD